MIAAQYLEAIRLQNPKAGWKFHDMIFENQSKLKSGNEAWLKKIAKKLGMNMKRLAKDVKSDKVKARIAADMKEATKFGISGTPGFILNGIPIKGAYPLSHFKKIVGELTKRGLLKL
jgi:protein-disulfide isomerase